MSRQKPRTKLQEIWQAYKQAPLSCRLRLVIRYLSCPFNIVLSEFPSTGRILDVGCGDGLLLYLLNGQVDSFQRKYVGIDVARNKIANARKMTSYGIEFHEADVSDMPSSSFDCVSIIDVLYLMPFSSQTRLLGECVRVLKADGRLIVKETVSRPKWKAWITYAQEFLSIHVVHMTQGSYPHFESPDFYERAIGAAGADVLQTKRIDAGFPYPHVLFLAAKR